MSVNPVRGEVRASIGSLDLTLVADMDGLARLSAATGYPTFQELYKRLIGTEPMTVMMAIDLFTIQGFVDGKRLGKEEAISQAKARLTLEDMLAMQGPLAGLLAPMLAKRKEGSPQGNAESAQSQ